MKPHRYQLVVIFWMLFLSHASATVRYVNVNNSSPASPYTSWANAATNIQNAIDAANPSDQILVTNGIYQTGGRVVYGSLTNRVVVNKAITVQSINGPAVTVIQGNYSIGDNAVRCVYMTNFATLTGFTLTSGATRNAGDSVEEQSGGGLWCESASASISNCVISGNAAYLSAGGVLNGTLSNCVISGNVASLKGNYNGTGGGAEYSLLNNCVITGNNAFTGGGVSGGTLYQCIVSNNSVTAIITIQHPYDFYFTYGGGLFNCNASNCKILNNSAEGAGGGFYANYSYLTMNNCLLEGNSAGSGGGELGGTLNNCTLVSNSGGQAGGADWATLNNCIAYYNSSPDYYGSTLNYCCTTLLPTNGVDNFTNAPLFMNATNDFYLQPASPCINAGNNAYVTSTTDLDGHPRIVGGTVDCGAYERQSTNPASYYPSVPSNLNAVFQGGIVTLNWPASFQATGYNVYRAIVGTGSYTMVASNVSVTNYTDILTVNGNTYSYYVTGTNSYGESLGSPEAIVYDVDHFSFAPIASPQTSSVPFTVSTRACDQFGAVLTNFNGAAILSGVGDHGSEPLTPVSTTAFLNGQWAGTVTIKTEYPDTNIRLTASSNSVSGTSNPFNAVAPAIQVFNNLLVVDLAYNPFKQRLYAVAPIAGPMYSNCLVVIDPVIGRVETNYYLGDDPVHLAVSSDGQFIYIGFNGTNVFRRFNLASNTVDLQVQMGAGADIAALPGLPHSVAVSAGGVAIFDDAVQRPNTYPLGGLVVAASPNELFTMGGGYPSAPFARLALDASGVTNYTYEDGIVGVLETYKCQAGLIFTSGGTVFNPDTKNILGHLTNCSIVEPDLAVGRIYSMGSHPVWGQPDAWRIYAWNATNLQLVGSLDLPFVSQGPSTLVRWGTNGIAFGAPSWYINQFFLVRTPLVPSAPPLLTGGSWQATGLFQLNFTGDQSVPYTVWTSTNLANWSPLGSPNLVSNGWFWFWDVNATNYPYRFYKVGIPQ